MYNSLDKQSVKQNTPIVAIGGCGQAQIDYTHNSTSRLFCQYFMQ